MSISPKKRVHFENPNDGNLIVKVDKDEETTADLGTESDDDEFGVINNLYTPIEIVGQRRMNGKNDSKGKKNTIRSVVIGMANILLSKQRTEQKKLLKNSSDDVKSRKFSSVFQRSRIESTPCSRLLNTDVWRNPNPMINLDFHQPILASVWNEKTNNVVQRTGGGKVRRNVFTSPVNKKDQSFHQNVGTKTMSNNRRGSATTVSTTLTLSPQSSVISRYGDDETTKSISTPIACRTNRTSTCSLNEKILVDIAYQSESDNDDDDDDDEEGDDCSVDEELEDLISITSNAYKPTASFTSDVNVTSKPVTITESTGRSRRVKKTTTKYMMYHFDSDCTDTDGRKS